MGSVSLYAGRCGRYSTALYIPEGGGVHAAYCDNGEDYDSGGLVDYADPLCRHFDGCQPGTEVCNDHWDNDGDDATDCEDTGCLADPACGPPELCNDGLDNDLDGATDCADPDCAAEPAPTSTPALR